MAVYRNESDREVLPDDARVLARSPLVFAMPEPMADALSPARIRWRDLIALADLDNGWAEHWNEEWDRPRIVISDPLRSTEGLLTLLSLGASQDEIGADGSSPEARITIDSDIGVLRLRACCASDAPCPASRRRSGCCYAASWRPTSPCDSCRACRCSSGRCGSTNRGEMEVPPATEGSEATGRLLSMPVRPEARLTAIYPTEGAYGADYPFVIMDGDWVDDTTAQVAEEFEEFILSDAGQERFEADGFRDADNSSNDVHRTEYGLTRQERGHLPPEPEAEVVANVRDSWRNVTTPTHTLMVVDVSGSMKRPVPGTNRTRLDATIDAAVQSLDVLPQTSSVGLWEFSTDLPGGANEGDYRELVPLGRWATRSTARPARPHSSRSSVGWIRRTTPRSTTPPWPRTST
jgi:hypothetical protein